MPIYEYLCIKCNKPFSALQRMGASEKDTTCPGCGSNEVRKKVSSFCCSPGGDPSPASSSPRFGGGGG
jgi:putative FmdB family regulatory protein